jgi:hypothetical protein
VHGIIEESDGVAEQSANNFGSDQAESGDHGPAEDGRFQRGMRVTVAVVGVTRVLVAMPVCGFGRIAGLNSRSVSLLLHPEIFYAFERQCAAPQGAYYAV